MALTKSSLFIDPKVPWLGNALKPLAREHHLEVTIEASSNLSLAYDGHMLAFSIQDVGPPDLLASYKVRLKGYYNRLVQGMPLIAEKLGAVAAVKDFDAALFDALPLTLENLLKTTVDLEGRGRPTKRVVLLLTKDRILADHDLTNV